MHSKLIEILKLQPFQPFRIELASDAVHVVRHPDQVMIVGTLAFVGVPKPDIPGPEYADVAIVSIPRITKLEQLVPQESRAVCIR